MCWETRFPKLVHGNAGPWSCLLESDGRTDLGGLQSTFCSRWFPPHEYHPAPADSRKEIERSLTDLPLSPVVLFLAYLLSRDHEFRGIYFAESLTRSAHMRGRIHFSCEKTQEGRYCPQQKMIYRCCRTAKKVRRGPWPLVMGVKPLEFAKSGSVRESSVVGSGPGDQLHTT